MMKSRQEKSKYIAKGLSRRVYEKPKLRTIELVAEEVLATGCKVFSGDPTGVIGNGCVVSACSNTAGS